MTKICVQILSYQLWHLVQEKRAERSRKTGGTSAKIGRNVQEYGSSIYQLVTNYGEGGGGGSEVLPLRKWRVKKVLAMLKGRHNKFWGSFWAVARSFSHIEEGAQNVSTL